MNIKKRRKHARDSREETWKKKGSNGRIMCKRNLSPGKGKSVQHSETDSQCPGKLGLFLVQQGMCSLFLSLFLNALKTNEMIDIYSFYNTT